MGGRERASDEHLDGDIAIHSSKTEGLAGDAGDASHEQMQTEKRSLGRLLSRKVQLFDRAEQSLRRCSGAEDLNDDELMEWRILSNVLNACDVLAIFSTARFTSQATRVGFREGFAVDPTTARPSGTRWDVSSTEEEA